MPVALNPLVDDPPVHGINPRHEQQSHQDSRSCTQRASAGSVNRPFNLSRLVGGNLQAAHAAVDQKIGRAYGDRGIGNLLQNLGDGGLRHALMGLEISPEHP